MVSQRPPIVDPLPWNRRLYSRLRWPRTGTVVRSPVLGSLTGLPDHPDSLRTTTSMPVDRQHTRVVAHLLPWPAVGGTEHATLRIAQAVRDRGFTSVACCFRDAASVHALFRDAGFDTASFDPVQPSLRHPVPYLRHVHALRRELRRRRVGLLHCADVDGALYGAAAAKLAGIPVLCHVRNQIDSLTDREQVLLRQVDRFAFVSRSTWQHFPHRVDVSRGTVLYDGAPMRESRDPDAARSVRQELRLPDDTRLIGMVARVSPQKDYFTLARAAARVARTVPNVRFVVVGDVTSEAVHRSHYALVQEELTRLGASNAFIFTGFRSDVPRLMSAFDVAVLSTNWEGLPLVVLESMALGIPTVATAVSGIPEVIPSEEVGLLFSPGDDAALARHLTTLLTDGNAARRIGSAGQSFVKRAFSMEAFADNVVTLYDGLLGATAADPAHTRTAEPPTAGSDRLVN